MRAALAALLLAPGAWASGAGCRMSGTGGLSPESRLACLAEASIVRPLPDLDAAALGAGPADPAIPPVRADADFHCVYTPGPKLGVTLKFFCHRTDAAGVYYDERGRLAPRARSVGAREELLDAAGRPLHGEDGRPLRAPLIKVKYLHPDDASAGVVSHTRYREVMTEAAGTRMLWALGLHADAVYPAGRVLCRGCAPDPFGSDQRAPTGAVAAFPHALVEYRLRGRTIERYVEQGWTLFELAAIADRDPGKRSDLEMLLLAAGVLNHHNRTAKQNRLFCPDDAVGPGGACARPVAYFDDVGGTFGGGRRDGHNVRGELARYARYRVFTDPARCKLAVGIPRAERVSEAGRREFARRAAANLSREKLRAILVAARFARMDDELRGAVRDSLGRSASDAQVDAEATERWAAAISARLDEIARARCGAD